jgi:hypothetical protein
MLRLRDLILIHSKLRMAEYASNNVFSQLRDLYPSISVLKKRLEELGISSETTKPKTELMVYTLLHKRTGAIEVDVDRGVVFTSDLVNGLVLDTLQDSLHIHSRLQAMVTCVGAGS